jgi:hypothetical protein
MTRKSSGLVLDKVVEKPAHKAVCQHFWLIGPALGPTSQGVCKYCGQKKTFLNIVEENQPKENLSRFFGKDEVADGEKEQEDTDDEAEDD